MFTSVLGGVPFPAPLLLYSSTNTTFPPKVAKRNPVASHNEFVCSAEAQRCQAIYVKKNKYLNCKCLSLSLTWGISGTIPRCVKTFTAPACNKVLERQLNLQT